ncbi:hypothetical protein KSS87_015522 [Heliosperma pusillum]|nr:hypothetical protein KSS87_015522 [Heliosperma pusillum]
MADSIEALRKTSKKRKQSPFSTNDSPFSGILTRRKSQKYFFSRNRSGRSRICDSFQRSSAQITTKIEPQLDADWAQVNGNGDDNGIKDLRARRVFSKPPKNQTIGKVVNPSCDSKLIDCKVEYNHGIGENHGSSIEVINGFGVNSKREGSIFDDLIDVKHDSSISSKNRDDCWVNLVVEDLNVENPNSLIDSVNPKSTVLKKSNDYKVNSMAMDLDVGNPNFLVVSQKCDSVINSVTLSSTVLKKCVNSGVGNPELQVSKKCDSRVSSGNPNLSVSEKCDVSRVDLLAEDLKVGGFDQSMASGKSDSVMIEPGLTNSMGNRDLGVDSDERVSDYMSPNVSNGFVKDGVGGSCEVVNEETLQSTPPDAVFIIRKSPTKQACPSKDGSSEGKNFSNSINGMTLNKCSRRKVFKVPNSFTYKRLLPYLMDMAKDEPCAMKANPSVNIEDNVEEKPFVSISQECTIDATKLPKKLPYTTAACVPEEVSIDKVDEFSADENAGRPVSCCAESRTNLVDSETQIPNNSEKGVSQDEHVSPDNLALTVQSSTISLEVSMKDVSLVEPPSHLSIVSQGGFETEKSLISKSQSSDKLATLEHVTGLAKGILKRNPRGCRGICSCLDCSSFRLNADKAFEFSRNQLLEADELAQDLIKELSNLKCMLKKSVTGATDVNQVEKACIRASNVEDMAKTRISQMHEDLYVHTRSKAMLRPRVNFSINVQENGHEV